MKKAVLISVISAVVGLCFANTLSAQEKSAVDSVITKDIEIAYRSLEDARVSAKYLEYRDIPNGLAIPMVELGMRKGAQYFNFAGIDIAEDDTNLQLNIGRYGKYQVNLFYDRLPHRFAFGALSRYSGLGTGNLVFPTAQREFYAGAGSSTVDQATRLTDPVNGWVTGPGVGTFNSSLKRTNAGASLKLVTTHHADVRLSYKREERKGTRPLFGSFGFGNTIEILEPLNYKTDDVVISADYGDGKAFASGSISWSRFNNDTSTLIWDNPLAPSPAGTAGTPLRGQLDLYPDNRSQSIALSGGLTRLPYGGNLALTYSSGTMKQNDPFLPYTINSQLNTSALGALPVTSLNGKVNTTLFNVVYSASLSPVTKAKVGYRFYDYENKTPAITFPGYVRYDSGVVSNPVTNEPVGFSDTRYSVGLDTRLDKHTDFEIGYTFNRMSRSHRSVESSDESKFILGLTNRPVDWFDLRFEFEGSSRRGEYVSKPQFAYPGIHTYDEANRNRQGYLLTATAYPINQLTCSASLALHRDGYYDSPYGLLSAKHKLLAFDVDYTTPGGSSIYGFYSRENIRDLQKAHQWMPNGAGDPSVTAPGDLELSDWTARAKDDITTYGAGLKLAVVPKKVTVGLSYSYAKANGSIIFASPSLSPHDATRDANAFDPLPWPNVDTSRSELIDLSLNYKHAYNLSFSVGYSWEGYRITDFQGDGGPFVDYVPVTSPGGAWKGALFAGTLPRNYSVHTLYGKVKYNF